MRTAPGSLQMFLGRTVRAVLLATADGFVVDAAAQTPAALDFDSMAAEVAGVFRAATLIGRDVADAPVRDVVITLSDGQTVAAGPIAGEAIGVLVPHREATYNDAVQSLRQVREAMHHLLEIHTGTRLLDAMSYADEVRPAARRSAEVPHGRPGRIALAGVDVDTVGTVASVRASLSVDNRRSTARAVGRDLPGARAILAGQATIRAMLDLLPTGHAVELTHLQTTTPSRDAIWVLTRFLSPDGEQSLFGIAPIREGDEAMSAARAILNAVNRRVELLLGPPPP